MSDTTIDDLNDDCLMNIFSFLTVDERLKTEEVCRRWLGISLRGWPHVKCLELRLLSGQLDYPKTVLHRCGRFLKNLEIAICNYEDILDLQPAIDCCSQLEIFKLKRFFFYTTNHLFDTTTYYDPPLQVVSKLQKLHTVELRSWLENILDEDFNELSVQNLKNLSIQCSTRTIFSATISRFSNLQTLTISYVNMTNASIQGFEKLQSLIELRLQMCKVPEKLPSKIAFLKYLRVLELNEISVITRFHDPHISAIAKGCPELEYLSLVGMNGVSDTCFSDIAKLSKLRTLRLQRMAEVTDRSIINMRHIHTLHLTRCSRITNQGLKQLIGNSLELHLLKIVSNEMNNTLINDVNEAIHFRGSSKQFTLEIFPFDRSLGYKWKPTNLSPLLILMKGRDNEIE